MKIAVISADPAHCVRFRINPEAGDATSFMSWISIFDGYHFTYKRILSELHVLDYFDVVLMSGHNGHLVDIVKIANHLKNTKVLSMFYPEGSLQLYDNSVNGLYTETYEAWRACDIISSAEEDKLEYYRSFVTKDTLVGFVHVPLTPAMSAGQFFIGRKYKIRNNIVIYGDNNPNHPMVAFACAEKLKMNVTAVEVDRGGKIAQIKTIFPDLEIYPYDKLSTNAYLRLLGRSVLHFYPTEWIGTAREPISCAVVGTPCIGSRDSHTQRRLFPAGLSFNHYDIAGMVDAAKELLNNDTLYDTTARLALEKAQFYSLENTMKRFIELVQTARTTLKKEKVSV